MKIEEKVKFKNKDVEEFTLSKSSYIDTTVFIPKEPKELTRFTVVLRKKETVDIDLVSFVPNHTSHGVKLERQLDRVIAYLEVIERSPNVKSVTKVTNNEDVLAQIGEPVLSPKGDMLAYSVFFNEKGVIDNRPTRNNLFYLLKDSIVGGPSIIFTRYHEVYKTFIRGRNKLRKKIIGYDANA